MRQVNREAIAWALKWNGYSVDDLHSAFPKLPMWLDGSKQPTIKQLEKFASKTHLIVPVFFAETVPEIHLQIADFRRPAVSSSKKTPSPALFDTIDEMLMRQGWMSDFFVDLGYGKNELVNSYANTNINTIDSESLATYISKAIGVDVNDLISARNFGDAFKLLRRAIEACGISVSVSGYAKNSTRRTFDVNEFRGFVLTDDFAPIIFINGRDAKSAQLFTLVHELTHLTLGHTGLFDDTYEIVHDSNEEHFCDQVAAEFLMPRDIFKEMWQTHEEDWREANRISKKLKVSFEASIRRAQDLSLIDNKTYIELFKSHQNKIKSLPANKGGYGNYHFTKGANLGDLFTEAVYMGVKSGKLLYSDAYKLTSMKADTFNKYYQTKGYAL